MQDLPNNTIVEIVGSIDIPDSAYEKAEARYEDLGEWFSREKAACSQFMPHIQPQGSFRLGTVVRPLTAEDEYDLDMSCRLTAGLSKSMHTQEQLKNLVGADLEDYRVARGIKQKLDPKHRCWRLKYADELNFHLDVVPSIPETDAGRRLLRESLLARAGVTEELADKISSVAGSITDDRLWNYNVVDDDWLRSDSEGFARWFKERMKLARVLLEKTARDAQAATIDDLPARRWKSPLQRCIQLLKRHRDIMFADDEDGKPPSVLLTALAARAYQGEADIGSALTGILTTMGEYANPTAPRVPNPVNPAEDFADKWSDPVYAHLNLEAKFWQWLEAGQSDFGAIGGLGTRHLVQKKLGVTLAQAGSLLAPAVSPSGLSFPNRSIAPKNPGGFA